MKPGLLPAKRHRKESTKDTAAHSASKIGTKTGPRIVKSLESSDGQVDGPTQRSKRRRFYSESEGQ